MVPLPQQVQLRLHALVQACVASHQLALPLFACLRFYGALSSESFAVLACPCECFVCLQDMDSANTAWIAFGLGKPFHSLCCCAVVACRTSAAGSTCHTLSEAVVVSAGQLVGQPSNTCMRGNMALHRVEGQRFVHIASSVHYSQCQAHS